MAYSLLGTYTGVCTNVLGGTLSNSAFKVDVYYEQNITANTTTLKFMPYVTKSGHGESVTWYFKLDGNDYYQVFCNTYVNSRVDGGEVYKTINHNNDGTCTTTLNVSVETSYTQGANANLNNYCMKWGKLNQSVTLPTIPRASSFTVNGNKIGSPISLNISRVVSSFTHQIWYKFGNINIQLASGIGTSYTFTPSLDDAKQIPNSTSGTCTITVKTYNGSAYIDEKSVSFNLYVADSMYPSFTNLALSGINTLDGLYIAGRSTVTAQIEGAVGSYNSTIKSYSITGSGLNSESASGTSSTLIEGTHSYVGKIVDSRGRSYSKSSSITVYTYVSPRIEGVVLGRCDSLGTFVDSGTYVKIDFNAIVQNVGNANKNAKSYKVEYRVKGATSWATWVSSTTLSSYTQAISIGAKSGFAVTNTYEIQITVTDSLSSVVFLGQIGTEKISLDIEENGVGIGKYHERGGLDVKGSIYTDGEVGATGSIGTHGSLYVDGFVNVGANITSQGRIFGTTFIQHSANYGTPLEVGRYIDLHNAGSTNDVDVRLDTGGTRDRLRISGGTDLSRYVEIGMNSNGSFLRDSPSGKYIQLRTDRLIYDGATVPHNWRQSFTPFIFSDTGNFNMVESWGEAVYLGDLVWIRGRVRGSRGGHSGSVYIGGLPVSCIAGYPALDIAFFGGVTASLGNSGFDIRAYLEGNASHSIITYSNKDTGGWHNLQCSHVTTGNMDISFSAIYRWR